MALPAPTTSRVVEAYEPGARASETNSVMSQFGGDRHRSIMIHDD